MLLNRIKYTTIIAVSLLVTSCVMNQQQQSVPIECEIISYGMMDNTPKDRTIGNSSIQPSKKIGTLKSDVHFTREGNIIQAKLGSGFGVKHKFSGGGKKDRLEVTLVHPSIDYGHGATTDTKWRKSAFDRGTFFFFDVKEELVSGHWEFLFKHNERVICSQLFDVKI